MQLCVSAKVIRQLLGQLILLKCYSGDTVMHNLDSDTVEALLHQNVMMQLGHKLLIDAPLQLSYGSAVKTHQNSQQFSLIYQPRVQLQISLISLFTQHTSNYTISGYSYYVVTTMNEQLANQQLNVFFQYVICNYLPEFLSHQGSMMCIRLSSKADHEHTPVYCRSCYNWMQLCSQLNNSYLLQLATNN